MIIPLGTSDWAEPLASIGRTRLRNMYIIDNPLSPEGVSRLSRPTLSTFTTVGSGPIYGIWQQAGSFNGDLFVVSGSELYRLSGTIPSLIGSIPGDDNVVFAGSTERLVVVRSSQAYICDGTTLTPIVMPDFAPVSSVACLDGVFLLTAESSQVFYWLNPGETSPDPLNFASVERSPDKVESVNVISDEIWFLGAAGPEVWTSTGDLDFPYRRIAGRVYTEGCTERHTVVQLSTEGLPCLIWMTDKRSVVLTKGAPIKVSTDAIEENLRGAENFRAWGFRLNKHDFYVLTCSKGTFVYDLTKNVWSRWDTTGFEYWMAHLGTQIGSTVYAGDAVGNKVWVLEDGDSDDGLALIHEVSGFVPHTGKQAPCYSVNIHINTGWSPSLTSEPVLELRWSDDLGITWSEYTQLPVGAQGEYEKEITFRSLGLMSRPGRLFEFRLAEVKRLRIDYATMNEV